MCSTWAITPSGAYRLRNEKNRRQKAQGSRQTRLRAFALTAFCLLSFFNPQSAITNMRILILHQFFYPDHSAVSQLMTDLAESLVERGVEVTAVAGRGLYNGGGKLPRREEYKGIHIERAWATGYG